METLNSLNLSNCVFERALETACGYGVKLLKLERNMGSEAGVNFFSDFFKAAILYRCEEDGSEHQLNVAVKTPPESGKSSSEIFEQQRLFPTELRVLRDVLPRIEALLPHKIGPQLWLGSEDPMVLIMEDLSVKGFVMKDRQKGLPEGHCRLLLTRLAMFHAGSVALFEKDPAALTSFQEGVLSPKSPEYILNAFQAFVRSVGEAVEQWPEKKYARIGKKLFKLAKTFSQMCIGSYKYEPDEFCVLNHGDCWVNNMMFIESPEGRAFDVRLVDYQMTTYTSPAIDLLYFLCICPEIDAKLDSDDSYLECYLASLKARMEALKCKTRPPSMVELKAAIHKRRVYAVLAGVALYPRMIANPADVEDMEVLRELNGETHMDVFKNPDAERALKKMLPIMDARGWLDYDADELHPAA